MNLSVFEATTAKPWDCSPCPGGLALADAGTAVETSWAPVVLQRFQGTEPNTANTPTLGVLHLNEDSPSVPKPAAPELLTRFATDLFARLECLAKLQDGWDGDEAPAPAPATITRARGLINLVGRLPDEIDPDAVGGIALWFYSRSAAMVMIGLRNNGAAVICAYSQGSEIPEVACAASDRELLGKALPQVARLA